MNNFKQNKEDSIKRKSDRQKIVEFMKWKSRMIKSRSFFNEEDEKDIMERFSKKQIDSIIKKISKFSILSGDSTICPWCVINLQSSKCKDCSFGKRHKICTEDISLYHKLVIRHCSCSIIEIIGNSKIKEKIKEIFHS